MTDPLKQAVICTGCWCVVALDHGEGMAPNHDRPKTVCSHLGPHIIVTPTQWVANAVV